MSHRVFDAGQLENRRRVKNDSVDARESLEHHQHDTNKHRPPMRENLVLFVSRSDSKIQNIRNGGGSQSVVVGYTVERVVTMIRIYDDTSEPGHYVHIMP